MAKLNIPSSIREGLRYITVLSEAQYQDLCSALESLPLRIKHDKIFDDSGLEAESIPADKFNLIKDALLPLYITLNVDRGNADVTSATLVEDVAESLKETTGDKALGLSEETIGSLKERLDHLLSIDRLRLVAKAHDVMTEHASTYSAARVFTDIRPVFGEKIDEVPGFAVIVHTLRITHLHDRRRQDFLVALDTRDVQELIRILERAIQKAETLHKAASSANMSVIDVV